MLPFREASIGKPIVALVLGVIVLVAVPRDLYGYPTAPLGWIVIIWAGVCLIGEILANGTARAQANGNLMFREANMLSPSLLGALGSVLVVYAPPSIGTVPLHSVGWVIVAGATAWLILEAVANGVTRARRRPRNDSGDDASGRPPIILE
ncbi:hypothetical protein [Brachybacterium sp. ACRRE]|uniref:hypothetical protein n=1 Tax=Brachybacterium sp. ACRRE TaxID=2918184 RepID=UPI001EF28B25|nr:hypothetical protein [Brachybacterium sp. ACRRE]MCG7308318.1 hypothetical protein [Brachybacterium sp. ACRRE]